MPFIFFEYKHDSKFSNIWKSCVESLQIVTQIAYSHTIKEDDIIELQKNVELHLSSIQKWFDVELIPKHHNLLHLGTLIRRMGPVLFLSMMRYESKHKNLKAFASQTSNFRNINKTISTMHQQTISTVTNSYADNIKHGKLCALPEEIKSNAELNCFQSEIFDDIFEVKWLKLNEWVYRKGLFIFMSRLICEIEHVLLHNGEYMFIVNVFKTIDCNSFLNCARIKEIIPKKYELVKLNEMNNKKVYEKKFLNGEMFIIIDSLETKYSFFE